VEMMIMNVKTMLSLAAASTVVVALASAPAAMAATASNESGTICHAYNAGDTTFIDYLSSGARSYKYTATQMICPFVRATNNTGGAWAYVDINHSSAATTTCTLYSMSVSGALLGSVSGSWTGSGFHEIVLNLTGAGKSAAWGDYAVLCTIPGSAIGKIMGVDLNEI